MCTGAGRRSFLTAQLCIEGTVLRRAPNLVQLMGWRLGMTRPDWLFQHLGVMGPKCAVTGGGATGRMHSKPQGFSTQPIAQPAHWHVSSQRVSEMLHSSTWRKSGHNARGVRQNAKGGASSSPPGHPVAVPNGPGENMTRSAEHIARGAAVYEPAVWGVLRAASVPTRLPARATRGMCEVDAGLGSIQRKTRHEGPARGK